MENTMDTEEKVILFPAQFVEHFCQLYQFDPSIDIDKFYFTNLLLSSLSLSMMEKFRVIFKAPKLSQFQVDELIKVFEDEQSEFNRLLKEDAEDVTKLAGVSVVESVTCASALGMFTGNQINVEHTVNEIREHLEINYPIIISIGSEFAKYNGIWSFIIKAEKSLPCEKDESDIFELPEYI